jgi:L-ribulose-5-phosphate 3-epimerase
MKPMTMSSFPSSASLSSSPTSSPSPRVGGAATARHRIGVCSWSLRPASPADLANTLRDLDIDAVQLALTPIVHQPEIWGDAPRVLREAGIDIISGMMAMAGEDYSTLQSIAITGGVRRDETWPENLEQAKHVADLAGREHIPLVTFHAGFLPHVSTDHTRGHMLDRLGTIADLFQTRGVSLAFETGQEAAETLIDVLDDLNKPNVGVNFDPANMILYGMGDPVEALTILSPYVRQIHVKDAAPTDTPGTWGTEMPVGLGTVDWPRFFEVAKLIQPAVNLVIEREAGAEREPDIARARDLIRANLETSGPII